MSLENLEDLGSWINKFEAISKYDNTKKKVLELTKKLENCNQQLKNVKDENVAFKSLKIKFADEEITLKEFNKIILKETQKTYRDKIKRRAKERFEAEAPSLTTAKLNQLLKLPPEKRPKTLDNLLTEERDLQVNQILKMPDAWPAWFKENTEKKISSEIQRRLDQIFLAKVREHVEEVKRVEWYPYLDKFTRDVITSRLQKSTMIKFIQELSNLLIHFNCPRCGGIIPVKLTADDIANLFNGKSVIGSCTMPQCKGLFLHTRDSFSLGDIIMDFNKNTNYALNNSELTINQKKYFN